MSEKNTGLRYDDGKLRYDLMPPDAIEEIVRVFTVGARKYAERNWENGMKWGKCAAALERHLAKWKKGASRDEEYPELYHMAMVAWNAIALLTYELRDVGENDIMGIHQRPPPMDNGFVHDFVYDDDDIKPEDIIGKYWYSGKYYDSVNEMDGETDEEFYVGTHYEAK